MRYINVNNSSYNDLPCGYVALSEAVKNKIVMPIELDQLYDKFPTNADGYMNLKTMNAMLRYYIGVRKYEYYKRNERPILHTFKCKGKAVVCVKGHYVFAENDTYYSTFPVDDVEVVAVWHLLDF